MQCIQTFHGLEQLDIPYAILDKAPSDPIRTVRSILSSVHSGSTLRSLKINLYPARPEWTYIYWVDRAGLLDLLLGEEMLDILSRFTMLRQLHLFLWENDAEYDGRWWTAEIVRRLPDSCHNVQVSVRVLLRMYGALLSDRTVCLAM